MTKELISGVLMGDRDFYCQVINFTITLTLYL